MAISLSVISLVFVISYGLFVISGFCDYVIIFVRIVWTGLASPRVAP